MVQALVCTRDWLQSRTDTKKTKDGSDFDSDDDEGSNVTFIIIRLYVLLLSFVVVCINQNQLLMVIDLFDVDDEGTFYA